MGGRRGKRNERGGAGPAGCITLLVALAVAASAAGQPPDKQPDKQPAKQPDKQPAEQPDKSAGGPRQWTDSSGKFRIEATFVDYAQGNVKLRKTDGKVIHVPISRLSRADRNVVLANLRERRNRKPDESPKTPPPPPPAIPPAGTPVPNAPVPGGRTGPPDPQCPTCRGEGHVPLKKLPSYVYVEGGRKPDPAAAVGRRYCPRCQSGLDPQRLIEAEQRRLAADDERTEQWKRRLAVPLVRGETHLLTLHSQIPAADTRRVGMALERLTAHLQQVTGSLTLTPQRPAADEMLILADKSTYLALLKYYEEQNVAAKVPDWHMMSSRLGSSLNHTSFIYRQNRVPLEHVAVYVAGFTQLQRACNYRLPEWLGDGFASYCESAVLGKNMLHSIKYRITNPRLANNWKLQFRQVVKAGQVRPWKDMLDLDLAEFQAADYLETHSIVTFLLTRPSEFLDFVGLLREGRDDNAALAQAYAKPIEQLEADWRKWLK